MNGLSEDDPERRALVAFLSDRGVSPADIQAAELTGNLGALVVDIATGQSTNVPFAVAVRDLGLDPAAAAAAWRALGFPDPERTEPLLRPEEVAAVELIASFGTSLLGEQAALTLARVVGTATSRVADAVVDAFRSEVEVPQLASGVAYDQVIRTYAQVVETALPQLQATIAACLRRHLVTAAAGNWTTRANESVPQRELAVGFVDLVGWTSLARVAASDELAHLLQRFEELVAHAAQAHRTRVVKLLGDGAMVVADRADDACAFGLAVVGALAGDPDLPAGRVGLAAGPVMTFNGDHHGPVVNLAARLADVATSGGVLVDAEVLRRSSSTAFGPARTVALRGLPAPVTVAVAVPAEPGARS